MSHRAPSEEENAQMRRDAISWLRFPFAVVVVFVHVYAGGFMADGVVHGYDTFPLTEWIGWIKNAFLRNQSVPIYFFIAGYVFFLGAPLTGGRYRRKMRNRVHSLLVPFLLWNLLDASVQWVTSSGISLTSLQSGGEWWGRLVESIHLRDIFLSVDSTGSSDFAAVLRHGWFPADIPLWFMGVLMLIAVSTPLLNWGMRRYGGWVPAMFGLLWFVAAGSQLALMRQILCGFFFFSVGGWFSGGGKDVVQIFRKYRAVSMIAYPTVSLVLLWHSATQHYMWLWYAWEYLLSVRQAAGVPFFFTIALMMAERCRGLNGGLLEKSAFFIYAAHSAIVYNVMRHLSLVIRVDGGWSAFLLMVATLIVSIAGLVGVYALMRRYIPKVLSPFAGGRV